VNQDQMWKLFDLVPGLDYCDRPRDSRGMGSRGKGYFNVVYNNPQSATYAREKLHGFECPPGDRMVVELDTYNGNSHHQHHQQPQQHHLHHQQQPQVPPSPRHGHMAPPPPIPQQPAPAAQAAAPASGTRPNIQNDLAHLTETIANATALLQAAGYAAPGGPRGPGLAGAAPPMAVVQQQPILPAAAPSAPTGETYDPSYCSVKLPPPQPLATMDSDVAERLFLVCTPVPPQLYALRDVFGRFGALIDIYMLNGKTCGYAKYASKESADRAVAALHGQEICGSRMKVMPADPQGRGGDSGRKRPRLASSTLEEPMV